MTDDVGGWASIPRSMLYDPNVPKDAKLVYLLISSHVGVEGHCWPSIQRLAKLGGVSRSTVKRQLAWLSDPEHRFIEITERQDPEHPLLNLSNEYRLVASSHITVPPAPGKGGRSSQNLGPDRTDGRSTQNRGVGSDRTTNVNQLNENQGTYKDSRSPAGAGDPATLDLPLDPELNRTAPKMGSTPGTKPVHRALPPGVSVNQAFDQWWALYPRKQAKPAAQKMFERQMRRGDITLDQVLTATRRFCDDPNREDAFTPHPATWLSQDRWADGPLPPRGDRRSRGQDAEARNLDVVEQLRREHAAQTGGLAP